MGTVAVALADSVSKSNSNSIEYDTHNSKLQCSERDSNPYTLRYTPLKRA